MARANEQPVLDVQAGMAALNEDIPRVLDVLGVASLEALGWERPNAITLLIPLSGTFEETEHTYLLKLGFAAYRAWPPSAQFVNPATRNYSHPTDQHHVPQLTSPECHTHIAYPNPGGGTVQLICCSATQEFYDVKHSVEAHHVWRGKETFLTTLTAIQKAMASHHKGPFPRHGQ